MMVSDATPSEPPMSMSMRLNRIVMTENASTLTISDEPFMQLSTMAFERHLGRTMYKTCLRFTQNHTAPTSDCTA